MEKPPGNIQKEPQTLNLPPAAAECLTQAQAALKAQAEALRKSLEEKKEPRMDSIRNGLIPLEDIPADRQLVDTLFTEGKLSPRARAFALDLLHPSRKWGLWTSRLLLALGTALVLSGVVYFYAFNWNAIPDMVKLGSVEAALVTSMVGALVRGLDTTGGKFMTLATAALIGVFLAVFGQVYQTGADAWTLFALWALLIIPFGVAASFAPIWGLWLVVSNLGLFLFWDQIRPLHGHADVFIYPILGVFNVAALSAREALVTRLTWLGARWTRTLPAMAALSCAAIPSAWYALDWWQAPSEVLYSAVIGSGVIAGLYCLYRFIKPDTRTLSLAMLAACTVVECGLFRMLGLDRAAGAGAWLLLGALTIALFASVIVWLRILGKRLEVSPWLNV